MTKTPIPIKKTSMPGASEWRVCLKRNSKVYQAFKIRQNKNNDITIIPKQAVYFPRKLIENLPQGSQLSVDHRVIADQADHYSLHVKTGQRHVKITDVLRATEPEIGLPLEEIKNAVPLVTIVAVTDDFSEVPSVKGKWHAYSLDKDVNYAVFELIAIPKGTQLGVQEGGVRIINEKATIERFDLTQIELRNCAIAVRYHSTNHQLTDIQSNIIFQLSEGKSVAITRVEKGKVLGTINKVIVSNS